MKVKIFKQTIYITKRQATLSLAILALIFYFLYCIISADGLFDKTSDISVVKATTNPSGHEVTRKEKEDLIKIYICGQVKDVGIYECEKGITIGEIVEKAGGMLRNANKKINLVYKINKNCMLVIPRKNEKFNETDIIIEGLIAEKDKSISKNQNNITYKKGNKININIANKSQLMEIPWVGESTAQAIINYRKKQKFNSIDEIKNVSGIGDGKYEKMKDKICV